PLFLARRGPPPVLHCLPTRRSSDLVTDEDMIVSTVLGSCVAVCLTDPGRRIAGMNHFLLPDGGGATGGRYGVYAMELLINGLMKDRKSTRLNSSHVKSSYAVFCLKN